MRKASRGVLTMGTKIIKKPASFVDHHPDRLAMIGGVVSL
jgi:hypothetical protein